MKKRLQISLIILWTLCVVWWVIAWLVGLWIIRFNCVDCNWLTTNVWLGPATLNWIKCCKWTYTIERMNWDCNGIAKPIIYLYPNTETSINLVLWKSENLWYTYPKYDLSKWWNVIAYPNWDLEDLDSWRKLYALYREWKNTSETNFDEWFIVEWKDIIPFLEEKLEILWLNEREAEEFIVYWLPQMEWNKWNLIRFESIEEQNENMPLIITPRPDTLIRVTMDWKAINEPIKIPEQKLISPIRSGFVVVEWWWSPRN